MSFRPFSIALLLLLPVLTACATVMNGRSQYLTLVSDPPGATATVDSTVHGVTPIRVQVSRKESHEIRFDLAGYQSETRRVSSHLSPMLWLDLLPSLSGALSQPVTGGMLVGGVAFYGGLDLILGGGFRFKPDSVAVRLAPQRHAPSSVESMRTP